MNRVQKLYPLLADLLVGEHGRESRLRVHRPRKLHCATEREWGGREGAVSAAVTPRRSTSVLDGRSASGGKSAFGLGHAGLLLMTIFGLDMAGGRKTKVENCCTPDSRSRRRTAGSISSCFLMKVVSPEAPRERSSGTVTAWRTSEPCTCVRFCSPADEPKSFW